MPFPLSAVTLKEKRPRGNKKEKKKKATNCFTARKTKKGGLYASSLSPPLFYLPLCSCGKTSGFLSLFSGREEEEGERTVMFREEGRR